MNEVEIAGIGFGPSNLATAVALKDAGLDNFLFLEKEPTFSWHPNMNLKEANLQNAFLKDLITLRNPQSPFTFLNYLHEMGRLDDFVNRRSFFPTRKETTDYMAWAARFFYNHVSYCTAVRRIFPEENGRIGIETEKEGRVSRVSCEFLILGIGAEPYLPVDARPEIAHTAEMLPWLSSLHLPEETQSSFLIVGGGQSSAEALYHLLAAHPQAKIDVASRRFIYKSLEESAFINNLFSEKGMNWFSHASPNAQKFLFKDLYEANFSAVDNSLLSKIYELLYEERWQGVDRVRFYPYCELSSLNGNRCQFWDRAYEKPREIPFDYALFATGYRYANLLSLLEPFRPFLKFDAEGIPTRSDDLSLKTSGGYKIFAHAVGDKKFGFLEGGMTNLAARAQRIVGSIEAALECGV